MRNYRKGEVALTSFGHMFRLVEDALCGSHWITVEMLPDGEKCVLREKTIVAVLEVSDADR
jgi:hypothetical protein